MSGERTPERRAAAAERIRATKPWLKATGPVTKAGKERSRMNALKHGNRRAVTIATRKALKLNSQFMKLAEIALIGLKPCQTNYKITPTPPCTYGENKNSHATD